MPYKRRKLKYVVFAGSKALAYLPTKSKSVINALLAAEYRKEHTVRTGKLRYAKRSRKR
jgi:hypothetical protein